MIGTITEKLPSGVTQSSSKSVAEGFANTFEKAFDDVNNQLQMADQKIADLATGRNKDIHGTMISLEKADISMKLLMAIRSKLVAAYEETMRMQV